MNVVIFPESTTQSLYCHLVCLSQTLLLCRIVSLVHTQLLHLPVTVHCYSNADSHSGGTGSQPLCNCVHTSQLNIDTHGEYPAYFSPRRQYRDCVVDLGNIITSRCEIVCESCAISHPYYPLLGRCYSMRQENVNNFWVG